MAQLPVELVNVDLATAQQAARLNAEHHLPWPTYFALTPPSADGLHSSATHLEW